MKAEAFSIGFGPELLGWVDRRGTRWRIAALPLGGYVRFKGDMNAACLTDPAPPVALTASHRFWCRRADTVLHAPESIAGGA